MEALECPDVAEASGRADFDRVHLEELRPSARALGLRDRTTAGVASALKTGLELSRQGGQLRPLTAHEEQLRQTRPDTKAQAVVSLLERGMSACCGIERLEKRGPRGVGARTGGCGEPVEEREGLPLGRRP